MANRIVLNTVSYHGKGAIAEIPGIAKTKGFRHVFVCSDPDLVRFGVTAKVTDLLEESLTHCIQRSNRILPLKTFRMV